MLLGQQRVHSHASAGCSGRFNGSAVLDKTVLPPLAPRRSRWQHTNKRSPQMHARLQGADEPAESPFKIKPGFFQIEDLYDREPDLNDPDWAEKVTDWHEFWNYTRWDMEASQLTDDVDTAGNPTRSADRAAELWRQVNLIDRVPSAVAIRIRDGQRNHSDNWTDPPVTPEKQEELPDWDAAEWRAFSEKQKYKQLLDMEWRRRQSKIGKLSYEHITFRERDVRMRRFEPERWDWSHDEIYSLITQDGAACKPEDHKAIVENPLATVDFSNTMGVEHIVETEDFIESLGHLGEAPQMELLEDEIIIGLLQDENVTPEYALEALTPTIEALDARDDEEMFKEEWDNWVPIN